MTGEILNAYGNITAETMIRRIAPLERTGNLHAAVYDFTNRFMYVVGSSPVDEDRHVVRAYDRPWLRLDMDKLFKQENLSMRE